MRPDSARAFAARVATAGCRPGAFNPWAETTIDEAAGNGPGARLDRLVHHLDRDAKLVLVGEPPSYQGARISGIAFTSEALVIEGAIPGVQPHGRLSTRGRPWSEPSGRIMWGALHRAGLADATETVFHRSKSAAAMNPNQ